MADVDIDPFGEHESRPEEPTDENIHLDPRSGASGPTVTPGGISTWEPECEQETSFRGRTRECTSQRIPCWRNIRTNR